MQVSQAVEQFIIYGRVEKQYAPETQSKIKECFDSWLLRHFGKLDLAEVRPFHVLAFREAMGDRSLSVARQYSLLMTLKLWKINARTWLSAYLQACADSGNQTPQDINAFVPWAMDETRLALLRVGATHVRNVIEGNDSS